MKNSLKIKINNLYNTKIEGVDMITNEKDLVSDIIKDERFTIDEVVDLILSNNQLLCCMYDEVAFKNIDNNVYSCNDITDTLIYEFMIEYGDKLTSKHIEKFFSCHSNISYNDIAFLLLCGGILYSRISEIANYFDIELSRKYIFSHYFVYKNESVNIYDFQNSSEYIEEIHLEQALYRRSFNEDVLDIIMCRIVEGEYPSCNKFIPTLCRNQKLSKSFVCKWKDMLDWVAISRHQYFDSVNDIDYNFFLEIKDYMIWQTYITVNPVSEKLYKIFADKLTWEQFKTRQQVTIDSEEIQLTIDKLDKFDIYDYNRIFCHHAIMTPKQTKLVRLYHKILLYSKHGNNNYNVTQFLAKLMLFFGCDRYFDNKLRHDLKKGGFQVEGDYVIGYVHKDFGQCINNRSYEQGLTRSYAASYEIIENSIDKGNNITVKVKVNIHDIHHTHYYYYPKTAIASIKANKFQFI